MLNMKTIRLAGGKETLVDDSLYDWLNQWAWTTNQNGYVLRLIELDDRETRKRRIVLMHKLVAGAPQDIDVDHKDRNKLNNQFHNLRMATRAQNMMNARGKNGSSKYRGVDFHAQSGKWRMRFSHGHLKYTTKMCNSELEAASLWNAMAREEYGEFAYQNLIDNG